MAFWDNINDLGSRTLTILKQFWGRLTGSSPTRKLIVGIFAVVLLGIVVLFSNEIAKLFNPPTPSGASLGVWANMPPLNQGRLHAQLIDVDQPDGKYLYAIGGFKKTTEDSPKLAILNTVERIKLNPDGSVFSGAVWETSSTGWGQMKDGHAAGTVLKTGDYVYMISGNALVTPIAAATSTTTEYPLLFSTIERLSIKHPENGWQLYANLSGVNFYPKATIYNNQIHIVGGIYGIPFDNKEYAGSADLTRSSIAVAPSASWSAYSGLKTVGSVGLKIETTTTGVVFDAGTVPWITIPGFSLTGGGGNTGGTTGGLTVAPSQISSGNNHTVTLAQVTTPTVTQQAIKDLIKSFSDKLLAGQWFTTVGEHYVLQEVTDPSGSISPIVYSGELSYDYTGNIVDVLKLKDAKLDATQVYSLGHLRFGVIALFGHGATTFEAYPLPQGRFGFEFGEVPNGSAKDLYIFGGAIESSYTNSTPDFWVIEDASYYPQGFWSLYGAYTDPAKSYTFVGNMTYKLDAAALANSSNPQKWIGTYADYINGKITSLPYPAASLSENYAFHSNSRKSGRAFFGLSYDQTNQPVVLGGLENKNPGLSTYTQGEQNASVVTPDFSVGSQSSRKSETLVNGAWTELGSAVIQANYKYNFTLVGIGNQLAAIAGLAPTTSNRENVTRMPDYKKWSSGKDYYWTTSSPTPTTIELGTSAPQQFAYPAIHVVRVENANGIQGKIVVNVYRIGGTLPISGYGFSSMPGDITPQSFVLSGEVEGGLRGTITSLTPPEGLQGEGKTITATGNKTSWNNNSQVELTALPDPVLTGLNNANTEVSWYDLSMTAGQSNAVSLSANMQIPNTLMKVEIIKDNQTDNRGKLFASGKPESESLELMTDSVGKVSFSYAPFTANPGLLKLKTTVYIKPGQSSDGKLGGVTDPKDEDPNIVTMSKSFWSILNDSNVGPYTISLRPTGATTSATDTYSMDKDQCVLEFKSQLLQNGVSTGGANLSLNFESEDDVAMDPNPAAKGGDGLVSSKYHRASSDGKTTHIFAWVKYGSNPARFVAKRITLVVNPKYASDSLITAGTITSTSATNLSVPIQIGKSAKLGWYKFIVTTHIAINNDQIDLYLFKVKQPQPYNCLGESGAIISSMDKRSGYLNQTVDLTITGYNTTFSTDASTVYFFPPASSNDTTPVTIKPYESTDPSSLKVRWVIPSAERYIGYWRVEVHTDNGTGVDEVAAFVSANGKDFFVTTLNGCWLELNSSSTQLEWDGESSAALTARVACVDSNSGIITYQKNVRVNFDKGTDDGSLTPTYDSTGNDGSPANSNYRIGRRNIDQTSDSTVTITASADAGNSRQVNDTVTIIKKANTLKFTLTASPTNLPLRGTAVSALTANFANMKDGNNNPVTVPSGTAVNFIILSGNIGSIDPAVTSTRSTNGTATSSYVRGNPLTEPAVVQVVAYAKIAGQLVYSNPAVITLGLNDSDYDLSLTASPTVLTVGGSQTSVVTAKLKLKSDNSWVNDWPIDFTLINAEMDDLISPSTQSTNHAGVAGTATITFTPGSTQGDIKIQARPVGMGIIKEVTITKQLDIVISQANSHIYATPLRMVTAPTANDNTGRYSTVIVNLRNNENVPIPNALVTLNSNRVASDTIWFPNRNRGNQVVTDANGNARFRISSTTIGTSRLTATASGGLSLSTDIEFVNQTGYTSYTFVMKTPFQGRDYNNDVWVYMKEVSTGNPIFINAAFQKESRNAGTIADQITDLIGAPIWLHSSATYHIWVKGVNHLAKSMDIIPQSDATSGTITKTLSTLPIGDIVPSIINVNEVSKPAWFHDNFINVLDFQPLFDAFLTNVGSSVANLNWPEDDFINMNDIAFLFANFGSGDTDGPPLY